MLAYLVPGEHEAIEPGKRRYNWVWYRNAAENRLAELLIDARGRQRASSIPPGLLSAASETDLREAAARQLPPAYRALVTATREPFLQTIQDLSVRRMAVGRVKSLVPWTDALFPAALQQLQFLVPRARARKHVLPDGK